VTNASTPRVALHVVRATCVVFLWAVAAVVQALPATLVPGVAYAAARAEALVESPLDARLRQLETELRCLVCQNQTLAESDAPLAADLRREIRTLASEGRSDDQIRAYLVARYGDFVLYKPPLKPVTWLLWLGPFALLLLGAIVWWSVLRRRARAPGSAEGEGAPSQSAQLRARDLLES
jgi:cytochrome c-type biogenesis protein CcmH